MFQQAVPEKKSASAVTNSSSIGCFIVDPNCVQLAFIEKKKKEKKNLALDENDHASSLWRQSLEDTCGFDTQGCRQVRANTLIVSTPLNIS